MASTDVVVKAFAGRAPLYEETMDRELWQCWGLSYDDFVSQLLDAASAVDGGAVLDVATGTARIPLAVACRGSLGGPIIGLDLTPAMVRRGQRGIEARGLGARIRLVCASAMGMPFAESLFDLVVCGLAMRHMDVTRVLLETRRVLRPGGHFVMAVIRLPSMRRSPIARVLIGMAALAYRLTHRTARAKGEIAALSNLHTLDEWMRILSGSGFSEVECVTTLPGRCLWYPDVLVIRASKAGHWSTTAVPT